MIRLVCYEPKYIYEIITPSLVSVFKQSSCPERFCSIYISSSNISLATKWIQLLHYEFLNEFKYFTWRIILSQKYIFVIWTKVSIIFKT